MPVPAAVRAVATCTDWPLAILLPHSLRFPSVPTRLFTIVCKCASRNRAKGLTTVNAVIVEWKGCWPGLAARDHGVLPLAWSSPSYALGGSSSIGQSINESSFNLCAKLRKASRMLILKRTCRSKNNVWPVIIVTRRNFCLIRCLCASRCLRRIDVPRRLKFQNVLLMLVFLKILIVFRVTISQRSINIACVSQCSGVCGYIITSCST